MRSLMWISSAAKNVLTYCLDLHNIIIYKFVKKITVPTSVLFGVILNHKSTAKLTPTVNYKHIEAPLEVVPAMKAMEDLL